MLLLESYENNELKETSTNEPHCCVLLFTAQKLAETITGQVAVKGMGYIDDIINVVSLTMAACALYSVIKKRWFSASIFWAIAYGLLNLANLLRY